MTETNVMTWEDALKARAAAQHTEASTLAVSASFISFKNGQLLVDKMPVAGNQLDVLVLAFMGERTYYKGAFDADAKQAPNCYSYRDSNVPHPEAAEPQADSCTTCPHNQWGSASNKKGKACREAVRVCLIPADDLSSEGLAKAPIRYAKIPVTSIKYFSSFLNACNVQGLPTFAVVTTLKVEPDPRTILKVTWIPKHRLPEEATVVLDLATKAEEEIDFTYNNGNQDESNQAPKNKKFTKE